eukprot:5644425-Prymnesium_polylepis.1
MVVASAVDEGEPAASAAPLTAAQAAQLENAQLRQALEEQHSKLLAQAEALKSLGATPDPFPMIVIPTPPAPTAPTGKKRGRPPGSKNKPKPPKDGEEAPAPPAEPPPKKKRGRPLGSKNKVRVRSAVGAAPRRREATSANAHHRKTLTAALT